MIEPRKFLGQNFLQDENVARKIVTSLGLVPEDVVLEIGAGSGALTRHLLSHPVHVIAVEVDPRAVEVLREAFGPALELLHADVRDLSLADLGGRFKRRVRVVGNIPYNITSDILFWLYDQSEMVDDATLMLQFEVARRLVARTGTKEYGILSVLTGFYTEPGLLFRVSSNSFYPKPGVESAVVRLKFKAGLPACDRGLFREIVRGTFGKRRKTLRNGLRSMGYTAEDLAGVGIDLQRRPEDLSLDEFLKLTEELRRIGGGRTHETVLPAERSGRIGGISPARRGENP